MAQSPSLPPPSAGLRVLFASSEAQPLIKTGGLADVAGSLPAALREYGHDTRLIIPAYPKAVKLSEARSSLCTLDIPGTWDQVRILEGTQPGTGLPVYLVDAPRYFCREGNPYMDVNGHDWGDNPDRFALFCRAVVKLAQGRAAMHWQPDLVHCNDWPTGLIPPLLGQEEPRPASIFTVHNLAYQGLFDRATFDRLQLPARFWSPEGLEFHNLLSFIKGGILFSDRVNTVSPTYAKEVKSAAFGCGLDGLLRHLGPRFSGILNGIDYRTWNPSDDPSIASAYDPDRFDKKAPNKLALQEEFGLPSDAHSLVFGYIGRLVEQKGVDLILDILPPLLAHGQTQLVLQGAGDSGIQGALRQAAQRYPGRVAIFIGYDEGKAHRIEAGCDCFLMPSRFEPCGLNQLYSLRYGTIPIVHRTGGLADTVRDATPEQLQDGTATGFLFDEENKDGLWHAVRRALELRQHPQVWWQKLATTGMRQDFSWEASARYYEAIYRQALQDPAPARCSR
jgi:starch synthase